MIDWKAILLIFAILVFLDKGLTYINIKQAHKNFPEAFLDDPYKIERNPVAKWFFQRLGILGGTVVYFGISILTLVIAYYFLSKATPSYALYIIVILYSFVIGNNFYFFFKYSKIIP